MLNIKTCFLKGTCIKYSQPALLKTARGTAWILIFNGSWFRSFGLVTENTRSPYDLVQVRLTARKFCEVDLSVRLELSAL